MGVAGGGEAAESSARKLKDETLSVLLTTMRRWVARSYKSRLKVYIKSRGGIYTIFMLHIHVCIYMRSYTWGGMLLTTMRRWVTRSFKSRQRLPHTSTRLPLANCRRTFTAMHPSKWRRLAPSAVEAFGGRGHDVCASYLRVWQGTAWVEDEGHHRHHEGEGLSLIALPLCQVLLHTPPTRLAILPIYCILLVSFRLTDGTVLVVLWFYSIYL